MERVWRIFVEKKKDYNVEAEGLFKDIYNNLLIKNIEGIRAINRYDISGIDKEQFENSKYTVFAEKTVDNLYDEELYIDKEDYVFAVEYLPGQFDQRADSAAECVQILSKGIRPIVKSARVIVLKGNLSKEDIERIKEYCINSVDSREALLEKPQSLITNFEEPKDVKILEEFINFNEKELEELRISLGLAMTLEDLKHCQNYFKNEEKRNPSITEIRVLDTYWSDHCRHTTFMTELKSVEFEPGVYGDKIKETYDNYLESRKYVYEQKIDTRPVTLMDVALIAMKDLRKRGVLKNLDESEEINAASIKVKANVNGKLEDWLVMFKNETHNHPTEIEPFGGAATCLGGAIRDPLSGRSYVYQAMRISGSGNPLQKVEDTLQGKLPQRKITTSAAHGYSSYGNQIGLTTGFVKEIYDDGFVAKRLELGAVIAAAPYKNVVRTVPVDGDKVILLGGKTGRDGCGGATGSSKEHTEESILTCGAEVQKGNPVTERKIQRLFRKEEVTTLIKRCNDFGAGGVSVAIGELTDGLEINLDLVPKKYEGLDGTELAISESQERMAIVVAKENVEKMLAYAEEENLEATVVATVNNSNRLVLNWRGKSIVNISRDFLNTNGAKSYIDAYVASPETGTKPLEMYFKGDKIKEKWLNVVSDLNVCSQKGLVERFDSTIGINSVLMPFGGKNQLTPVEAMVCKIPVLRGDTTFATIMSAGYNPNVAKWSPYHGAIYSVVESVAKIVVMGGKYEDVKLTFQEYFERLGNDPHRWGKPLAALLGAFKAQKELGLAAIGGKDSMSGTFKDLDVPPTLVSFAVGYLEDCSKAVSQEFKKSGHKVVLIKTAINKELIPDFESLKNNFKAIEALTNSKKIYSAHSITFGGICEAISKMAVGNALGFKFENGFNTNIFEALYGSILLEIDENELNNEAFKGLNIEVVGTITDEPSIEYYGNVIAIDEIVNKFEATLEPVFPSKAKTTSKIENETLKGKMSCKTKATPSIKVAKPRILIPTFPGTNCEYDSQKAFENAGGEVTTVIFNNLTPENIAKSIDVLEKQIRNSQIVMFPGGFSAGDEPDGSGKFIATVFRNPRLKEAIMDLLNNRDGLMLGICNGFQALIKLGLVPYGEIRDIDESCPTLTYNTIGRHISTMSTTEIVSTMSPWLQNVSEGDIHSIPISHGEGRFVASEELIKKLYENGQIATKYVGVNPNGSYYGIEGITSPDGRIFGKMGHSERNGANIHVNLPGNKDQKLFEAGVNYFK
jgi:phosphoribosylformylglycinamidine synthase